MSDAINALIALLSPRVRGRMTESVLLVVPGEGSLTLTHEGAYAGSDPAKITLIASAEIFENIARGRLNPVTAYMGGRLTVEGSTTRALEICEIMKG